MAQLSMRSPVGPLTIFEDAGAIISVKFEHDNSTEQTPLLLEARDQLNAYFDRTLETFSLPMAPRGTDFQRAAWKQLLAIPYGSSATYGAIAKSLNSSPRAVGGACGANPILIFIPCHRVVGGGGRMTGYSGGDGIETKLALLKLENYRLL